MSKNADRILWSVLLLALGVSLFFYIFASNKTVLIDLNFGVWNGVVKYVD